MPFAYVHVALLPAANDLRIESDALQLAFDKFRRFLRVSHLEVSTPMSYQDVDSAGGGYVGEFRIPPPRDPTALGADCLGMAARAAGAR